MHKQVPYDLSCGCGHKVERHPVTVSPHRDATPEHEVRVFSCAKCGARGNWTMSASKAVKAVWSSPAIRIQPVVTAKAKK